MRKPADENVSELKHLGFAEIFSTGTETPAICRYVAEWWEQRS